jgi:hypothetical protein
MLVQHPTEDAASAVRSATELPAGVTPTRGSTNTPTARAPDARAAHTQRGSQSTRLLYSPSSPRARAPLAAAHTAHRAAATSPSAHKASRSAAAHRTEEHSSAQHGAQSPDETARAELRRKLTSRALPTADSGATSQRSTSTAAARQQSKPRRRAREPQAAPQHQTLAHVDTVVSPRGRSTQHHKAPPRKARVYCGQNKLDPSLRVNGGTLEVGTRSRCFRSGFGAALHQDVVNAAEFIRKFTAPYEPLVSQKLWYKDKPPPEGYQPTTLSQARQRGFGAGSAALARKLQKERHGGSTDARSDLVRRPVARA